MKINRYFAVMLVGLLAAMATSSLPASSVRADVIVENGFNFREFRVNPPLSFTQGPDLLIVGADVVDTDTSLRPAGAIATARNLETNEAFTLIPFGSVGFSLVVPYTPERATGNWIVEVSSDVGSAASLLPGFGTGPGTGVLPGVGNLAVVPGPQPELSWDLPADLPLLNDGNVDRIRLQIDDSNGDRVLDEIVDETTLTTTSATVGPGVITHNGAFVGQVLLEGLNPFDRSRTYEVFVIEEERTGGRTVTGGAFLFQDNRQANSTTVREGVRLVIDGEFDGGDSFPFEDTFVYGENGGVIVPLPQAMEADRRFQFAASIAGDPDLTNSWNIVAWNGGERSVLPTNAVGNLDLLAFVRNVRMTPDFLTPTFEWDLPTGSTVPFDFVQIGLFDDVTDDRLSVFGPDQDELFETLPPNATSYTFEPGALEEGRKYVVRVVLSDLDAAGFLVNRSLSFFNFTPILATATEPLYVPNADEGGAFAFDFDVTAADPFTTAVPTSTGPSVAVGYEYAVGEGNPNFASVTLPPQGDNSYDVVPFDDAGNSLPATPVAAGETFDFTAEVDPSGVDKFLVLGIEEPVSLALGVEAVATPGQADETVFTTTLTFTGTGEFTGNITPLTTSTSTSVELIGALRDTVQVLVDVGELDRRKGRRLTRILDSVLKSIELDRINRGCRRLDRFIGTVEDLIQEGELGAEAGSPLPLVEQAEAIKSSLGFAACDIASRDDDDDDDGDDDD